MCLIAFAFDPNAALPLVLAGNRDEYHARPTAAADWHPQHPDLFGGRDLRAGGGWLQLSRHGRLAAVTNVRRATAPATRPRSRGHLVTDFLVASSSAPRFGQHLAEQSDRFGLFNALFWDGQHLVYASNDPHFRWQRLPPGLYGLSNGALDTPWPKAVALREALGQWRCDGHASIVADPRELAFDPLFQSLADRRQASDDALPDTGVGIELERILSAPFIAGDRYGTRASTVIAIGRQSARFVEKCFGPDGARLGERDALIAWDPR